MDPTPTPDLLSLAKDIAIPLISGAAGVAVALWRSTIQLTQDIRELRQSREHDHQLASELKILVETAKASTDAQIVKIAVMESQLATLVKDEKAQEAALFAFTKEQGDSWLQVNRTLAGIEQILKERAGQKKL